jgi:hypothetical protein
MATYNIGIDLFGRQRTWDWYVWISLQHIISRLVHLDIQATYDIGSDIFGYQGLVYMDISALAYMDIRKT